MSVNILMVDDDSIDVKMFQRSLLQQQLNHPVYVACNGEEALNVLRAGKIPKPLLIMLDLNMPKMNGIEFLRELRQDRQFHDSVVFVMTTSNADTDKLEAYRFNIAGYMIKSELGDNMLRAVELINCYSKAVRLPA